MTTRSQQQQQSHWHGHNMSTRPKVLSLYRSILRTARTWQGGQQEQDYIRQEACTLFRQNKVLQDPEEIEAKIQEAEDRLEIGVHYQIPYPRMYHAPQFRKRQYMDVPIIK